MSVEFPLLEEFVYFVKERQAVHDRRTKGLPAPWTDDPILRTYRFCNVRREDDRVTRWIHEHWLRPNDEDPNLWLARLLNKPESLEACGYPVPWKPEKWAAVLDAKKARGDTIFSGAYMIHADATPTSSKVQYLAARVLTPMWEARKGVAKTTETLAAFHARLMTFRDMGSFMAGQVIADVKWSSRWRNAPDWTTFACPGPGSMRGLNRVRGAATETKWKEGEWLETLLRLRKAVLPKLPKALRDLDAANLQNCNCEFDKWCRVKYAEG